MIGKWLTDPRAVFPAASLIVIFALSFFIGSAMQASNLQWLALAASGMGKALAVITPWIAGVAIAVIAAVVIVEVVRSMPKEAFVPIAAIGAPAAVIGVCAIWAKPANMLVFGAVGILALLLGICRIAERGKLLADRDQQHRPGQDAGHRDRRPLFGQAGREEQGGEVSKLELSWRRPVCDSAYQRHPAGHDK